MTETPLLPRRRLVGPLAESLGHRIAVVQGEAGSGKSTLLRLLEAETGAPVSRCIIDERCARLPLLVERIGSALPGANGGTNPGAIEGNGAAAQRLLHALRQQPPFVLALDDLHLLPVAGPVADFVRMLVEAMPRGAGLVLLTRGALPIPLGAYRARDRVFEIGPTELALSPDETRQLIEALAPERPLTPALLERLHERIGGWTVAAVLFAAALRDRTPEAALAELDQAHGSLSEFLADAVLRTLGEPATRHLEYAAALSPFDVESLESVCGEDPRPTLDAAHAHQLLVSAGGDRFDFSGLLGDVLRARARASDESWRAVQQRCAARRREVGELELAVGHLLEAGEFDEAIQILVSVGFANLRVARLRSLERHLEALGAARIEANPALRFLRATLWGMQPNRQARALADLEAIAELESLGPLAAAARGRLGYAALWRGDFVGVARWMARALELASPVPDGVAVYAHAMRGLAMHHLGRDDEAANHAAALDAAEIPYPESFIPAFHSIQWQIAQGEHEAALQQALALTERTRTDGRLSPATALVLVVQAAYEAGQLDRAIAAAREAITLSQLDDEPWWGRACQPFLAAALAERGERIEACAIAREALAGARSNDMTWIEIEALLALAAAGGDVDETLAVAEQTVARTSYPALSARVACARARRAMERSEPGAAQRHLVAGERVLGDIRADATRNELRLLRARLAVAEGASERADPLLRDGLRTSAALRADRPYLVPSLLRLAEARDDRARREILEAGTAALPMLESLPDARAGEIVEELLEEAAGPLEIESLGALCVVRGHARSGMTEFVHFRSARVAQLLCLLLLRGRERPISQGALIDALWPTAGAAGPNRLQTHLSYLRRSLEPHLPSGLRSRYIHREGDAYRLDLRGGQWDATVFERQVTEALGALQERRGDAAALEGLEAALPIYRGRLFHDQPELEWGEAWGTRLADLFVAGSLAAARTRRDTGNLFQAEEHLDRLLTLVPETEEAWQLRILLATDQGRRSHAKKLLARCRRALREHLDAEPSRETVRLVDDA